MFENAPARFFRRTLLALAMVATVPGALRADTINAVQVTPTPGTSSLAVGASVPLSATVIWYVDGIANGNATVGTISGTGANVVYTAPASGGTHIITASSVANATNPATVITVQPSVAVTLSPGATTAMNTGGSLTITASVTGSTNTAVTWTVDGIANTTVGTLSGTGNTVTYVAPATAGTHTVLAKSVANPAKSAALSINLLASMGLVVNPATTNIGVSDTKTFIAAVTGTTNTAVTWTVDGIANGNATVGTITGTGNTVTYKAPATAGSHTVAAQSLASASLRASSTVNVNLPMTITRTLPLTSNPAINVLGSMLFAANVAGASNTSVVWAVDGITNGNAAVGTIIPLHTGNRAIYTAPSTTGSHKVTASCVANLSASVSTPVTVGATSIPTVNSLQVVNVRNAPYSATGNGATDDTAAIQKAINAVAGTGGQVLVPAGTYMINPLANAKAGLHIGSNMTLALAPGAILQAMSTSAYEFAVVCFDHAVNANLTGGTIVGNRNNNTITAVTEGGMGISISGSQNIVVEGVTVKDNWCDGIYIPNNSQNVTLSNVVARNNRRNGMSIVYATGVVARGCTFEYSTGMVENGILSNGGGVDLEPNAGQDVSNVLFSDCKFNANSGSGLLAGTLQSGATMSGIVYYGNTLTGNGTNKAIATRGIWVTTGASGFEIINNTLQGNTGIGLQLAEGANNSYVTGNTITNTLAKSPLGLGGGQGIMLYKVGGNILSGNIVTGSQGCGLRDAYPTGTNTLNSNVLTSNGGPCS